MTAWKPLLATLGAAAVIAAPGAAAPRTSLVVTYWPHGESGVRPAWTLRCSPAAGSHPAARAACAELVAHPGELAPPAGPCNYALVKGAPLATVRGMFQGKRVERQFRPACDTRPWHDLHALLTGK